MSRLSEILSDDTNQFGPGTDLTISLLAVMLVIALITSHLYQEQRAVAGRQKARLKWFEHQKPKICPPLPPPPKESEGGHFRPASEYFTAADFFAYPVTRLVNPRGTGARIDNILHEYRRLKDEYPFIFVIGHSNALDDPRANDDSAQARQKRNLEYALRRASLIAGLMQEKLDSQELDHLVAVTTGEADLRNPGQPLSQENAWVEVMFGKEWKPPYRQSAR
jgi:hypothetical protein